MPLLEESATTAAPAFQSGLSSQESLSSLYPPPYSNRNFSHMKIDNKDTNSKFKMSQAPAENPFAKISANAKTESQEAEEKSGFFSIILALLGSNLLTLGLMLAFFSDGGFLRLEWSSKYWFVYCLIALPMVYAGLKQAKEAKEPS